MQHAHGEFDVQLPIQPAETAAGADEPGRRLIDKQFRGDLIAISRGQMLALMTDTTGSAGYVAMERVTGHLHGRNGSFALQHSGTMTRGTPQLTITVVPDSGTGAMIGLSGSMAINIVDGKHFYVFDYTLPDQIID